MNIEKQQEVAIYTVKKYCGEVIAMIYEEALVRDRDVIAEGFVGNSLRRGLQR